MCVLLCFAPAVFLNLMVDLFGGIAHYLCSVSKCFDIIKYGIIIMGDFHYVLTVV